MNTSEKIAYLIGLTEGYEVNETSKEGRIIIEIIKILGDLSDQIDSLDLDMDQVHEELDCIDDELGLLLEEDFDGCDDPYCGYDDPEYDGDLYHVFCPNCDKEVILDEEMLDEGKIICPDCLKELEFDFNEFLEDELD